MEKSSLEPNALQAVMTMPALLLQKPHNRSKAKDHIHCMKQCLEVWKAGRISELVQGRCVIQQHLPVPAASKVGVDKFNSTFARLIFGGKIKAALLLLANFEDSDGGVLPLNAMIDGEESVQDDLKTKHLTEETPQPDMLLVSENPANAQMHLVLFEGIDEDLICSAALRTHGRAGPSSLDASDCRHLCTSFHTVSDGLCKTLALLAWHLCTEVFDFDDSLQAYVACRLVPLDKGPGMRPIGICEIARRIIGKALLTVMISSKL